MFLNAQDDVLQIVAITVSHTWQRCAHLHACHPGAKYRTVSTGWLGLCGATLLVASHVSCNAAIVS